MGQLIAEYLSCCDIIAIGEAARHHQYLEALQKNRLPAELIDMNSFRESARSLKSELRFQIAVSSWRSKNQDTGNGGHHFDKNERCVMLVKSPACNCLL